MNKKILATVIGVLFSASFPAVAIENVPYLKLNIGAGTTAHKFNNHTANNSFKKRGQGVLGGASYGHSLGNMDVEIELLMTNGLLAKDKKTTASMLVYSMKNTSNMGLFNGQYNLKSSYAAAPFINGGIGYGHNKTKFLVNNGTNSKTKLSVSTNGIAYHLGFGLSYEAPFKTSLQIGYRFINPGSKKKTISTTINSTSFTGKTHNNKIHAIMLGLKKGF